MKNKIIEILENVMYWETCPQEYKDDIQKFLDTDKSKQLNILDVVRSFPSDDEISNYIDTLPYYGTCTTEYNEGFEDGVKWIKQKIVNP